jgi:hypothetical protein
MAVESLKRLKTAFDRWRGEKRHVREPMPQELMERALRAVTVHGLRAVSVAVKIDPSRLKERVNAGRRRGKQGRSDKRSVATPTFSRVEVTAPASVHPLAEAETVSGMKLRVFAITPETVGLLCALGGSGMAS